MQKEKSKEPFKLFVFPLKLTVLRLISYIEQTEIYNFLLLCFIFVVLCLCIGGRHAKGMYGLGRQKAAQRDSMENLPSQIVFWS